MKKNQYFKDPTINNQITSILPFRDLLIPAEILIIPHYDSPLMSASKCNSRGHKINEQWSLLCYCKNLCGASLERRYINFKNCLGHMTKRPGQNCLLCLYQAKITPLVLWFYNLGAWTNIYAMLTSTLFSSSECNFLSFPANCFCDSKENNTYS